MKYANHNIIEFIGNLILTYPDRFVINIYCNSKKSANCFITKFIKFFSNQNVNKIEMQDMIRFVNNNKELNIFKTTESIIGKGKRWSFALIEDKISIEVIDNLIKPMCNFPICLSHMLLNSSVKEDKE